MWVWVWSGDIVRFMTMIQGEVNERERARFLNARGGIWELATAERHGTDQRTNWRGVLLGE